MDHEPACHWSDKKSHQHLFARKAMRYQFIAQHRQEYPITLMCRVLEVSVSGYYAWSKRPPSRHSREDAQLAPNLLQRDFSAEQPNTRWMADTTYIWTAEGWLYLAVVLDLFSRMVVGWSMAATQDATLVIQALRMAITRRRPQAGLLHHSDRGSTYTSENYQALLEQEGMIVSMSQTADCYDHAAMESSFHSFKGECIDSQSFQTRAQARSSTFDYIETFYNRTRRHSTLQYMSPLIYEQLMC